MPSMDYFKHFELLSFSHKWLSFKVIFYTPSGAVGKVPRKFLSFAPSGPVVILIFILIINLSLIPCWQNACDIT